MQRFGFHVPTDGYGLGICRWPPMVMGVISDILMVKSYWRFNWDEEGVCCDGGGGRNP